MDYINSLFVFGSIGLSVAFSNALAQNGRSCNVVAALYYDYIFVAYTDITKVLEILKQFSN
ncbi:hypothetical protein [Flavobacterium sp. W22_SRS_FP1]|uniref:hypothetical protein n=1 Tax=Flavobacterium sp. W22_SRS_FP1 TaxID=3240276 RepID=UPI003F90A915